MKPALLLALAGLVMVQAVPASAQTDAGTPPINPSSSGSLPDSLKVTPSAQPGTLSVSQSLVKSGRPVKLTFRVVNTSGKPVTYNFGTGQRFDVVVINAAGTAVWNWAANKRFSQSLASISLASGKALVYRAVWNGRDLAGRPVPPGPYTAEARLLSDNHPPLPAASW